jgi:hypothetical protein
VQLAFIIVYILGFVFFALKKRRFDVLSLAYFSAGVYFMPGFMGVVVFPLPDGSTGYYQRIDEQVYWVFILVVAAILAAAVFHDQHSPIPHRPLSAAPATIHCASLLTASLFFFGLEIYFTGISTLLGEKGELLDVMTRGLIMYQVSAALLLVVAYCYEKWIYFSLAFLLLIIDVYIGFRIHFAVAVIAVGLCFAAKHGSFRLVQLPRKYILLMLCFGAFVFIYKGVFTAVKLGAWEVAEQSLMQRDYYEAAFFASEPFVTQLILNEAIVRDFHMEPPGVLDYVVQLIPFVPELGLTRFLRPVFSAEMILPGYNYGLGFNIWAEMWVYGHWPLLLIFVLFFAGICAVGSRMMLTTDPLNRATIALFFAFWAFYIHRNTLAFQITVQKRVIFAFLFAFCIGRIFYQARSKRKQQTGRPEDVQSASPASRYSL